MKYYGHQQNITGQASGVSSETIGVLLVNLGTPEQATTSKLRCYLAEFLMDPRVIELPFLLRLVLVRGLIVNFRAGKSAASYAKIWTDAGSPLLTNSQNLSTQVARQLGSGFNTNLAMRYGKPSVREQLQSLHERGIHKLIVVPLYPQYSGSTTGSVFDSVSSILSEFRWVPEFKFVASYYQQSGYISAVAESIKQHWAAQGQADKLIMSFHGLPEKMIHNGDPYQQQCVDTANQIAEYLDVPKDRWMIVFQSRFGAQKWLQPYCDTTLHSLPAQGVKSVDIVCPGFSVDCLETLMEINVEYREIFLHAGGERFSYIECLNDQRANVDLISTIIKGEIWI